MLTMKRKKRKQKAICKKESDFLANELNLVSINDSDYSYDFLIDRLFSQMKQDNSEGFSNTKDSKIHLPKLIIGKIGGKRTILSNFMDICSLINRDSNHVKEYIFAEFSTTGNFDGNGQLVIIGRFQEKQFKTVISHYITQYVICKTCKGSDTVVQKQNKLFFLSCKKCLSTFTVPAIKSGFNAINRK